MYGIIGYGVVGKAIGVNFGRNQVHWWAYDVDEKVMANIAEENRYIDDYLNRTSVVFVCVPTPARSVVGHDTGCIEQTLYWLAEKGFAGQVVITSTTGTKAYDLLCDLASKLHGRFNLVVCPEFLRAKHAVDDLWIPRDTLIYGPALRNSRKRKELLAALNARHSYARTYKAMSPEACSLIKTNTNLALAAKLITASVIYASGTHARLSPRERRQVLEAVFNDSRLRSPTRYHTVAEDGHSLGFGGACLPKDVRAISEDLLRPTIVRDFAQAILVANRKVRPNE